ncbi:RagB/SusD family nutrient uptake outer membrane protein [Lacibacter luteus]|uniref:RagB/SusD family nutrient uptake outer membrane protein n=1 Tax=Lacibacter luteus TaxID=2508719 RepID=A0A4Q1CGE8_9BACT|nr:RagB/SusD family nutrient uptake outer membrane protein [Lacibacter luteus]RXK58850.1 RagB/SusD family nutrient uptake outer membrane protein [Lacibacter luteus]
MQSINNYILIFCFAVFVTACEKFVRIPVPETQVQAQRIFSDERSAEAALTGLYAQLTATTLSITNGGLSIYPALSADELYNTSPSADLDPFYTNSIPATNGTGINTRLWSAAYKYIYHCNSIIEQLETASLSAAFKNRAMAEAKLIRSLLYSFLVQLFNDVPLVLTTSYETNAVLPRTASAKVLEQMLTDAADAYDHLPLTGVKAKPVKATAAALLARYYLLAGNYAEAEKKAALVIDANTYSLAANLNNVFTNTSTETIWHLPKDQGNTAEGAAFVPASATVRPAYALSNSLLNAFEPNDQRKTAWTKSNTVSGFTYVYPNKYKARLATPVTEAAVVIRVAELLLIRAEARAKQDKLVEATADMNSIRLRAGLTATNNLSKEQLLLAIEKERRTELFTEWGHRWFDLKRTGRIDEVMQAEKPGWKSTAQWYPIPQNELLRNAFLTQNPGYE